MNWLKGHQGHKKFIPRSERQGLQLAQETLFPLQAQIAIMFGRASGDLDSLREGVEKLIKGETLRCDSCFNEILKEGHDEECQILIAYRIVMETPPT